jgi:hypothetical protein
LLTNAAHLHDEQTLKAMFHFVTFMKTIEKEEETNSSPKRTLIA